MRAVLFEMLAGLICQLHNWLARTVPQDLHVKSRLEKKLALWCPDLQ
jgi:hypothetical protein